MRRESLKPVGPNDGAFAKMDIRHAPADVPCVFVALLMVDGPIAACVVNRQRGSMGELGQLADRVARGRSLCGNGQAGAERRQQRKRCNPEHPPSSLAILAAACGTIAGCRTHASSLTTWSAAATQSRRRCARP